MIISEVIDLLSIDKTHSKTIGSFQNKNLKYYSDVDIQEYILHMGSKKFIKKIKKIVNEVILLPYTYFIDFKLGVYRGKSIHFTQKEVLLGKKTIELKKEPITLGELLLSKSIIKLDIAAFIDNKWIDFSINFYYMGEGLNTQPDFSTDLSIIFKSEFHSKVDEGRYMKALKRLYSLSTVEDNHYIKRQLEFYLNSNIGNLDHVRSIVSTLKTVLELDNFRSWETYESEVAYLIDFFKRSKMVLAAEILLKVKYSKDISKISSALGSIISAMDKVIEPSAKEYLKNLRKLPEFLFIVQEKHNK